MHAEAKNKNPKVSVIVPCYKVEKYLDRCINSLVNQSLQDIEIILVDDGSSDHVPEMCDLWGLKDNRIKVIHKQNEGLGYARNSGLEIVSGEYVAFVDSDDYVSVDTYRIAYEEARREDACAVFFGMNREYKEGKWSPQRTKEKQIWIGGQIKGYMLDMIACAPCVKDEKKWPSSVCCCIYQRSIIHANNLRFLSERDCLSEDLLFNINFLGYANKIVYVPQMLYYYCLNLGSITTKFRLDMYDKLLCQYKLLIQKMSKIEGGVKRVDRHFMGYVRVYIMSLVASHHEGKRRIISNVLNDRIWDKLKLRYSPNWLPLYQNIFYRLIIGRHTRMLICYAYMANLIRSLLIKKR